MKSGYWVAANLMDDEIRKEVSQPSMDVLFQSLWQMNTSPKINHFLWRCLNECLPMGETMRYRHLARDGVCSCCQSKNETINHFLFQCPYARLVWALSPVHAPPGGEWSDSLYENFYRIICLSLSDQVEERVRFMGLWIM